jgi:hypothetical protein
MMNDPSGGRVLNTFAARYSTDNYSYESSFSAWVEAPALISFNASSGRGGYAGSTNIAAGMPVVGKDKDGNTVIYTNRGGEFGSTWSSVTGWTPFSSHQEAMGAGIQYINNHYKKPVGSSRGASGISSGGGAPPQNGKPLSSLWSFFFAQQGVWFEDKQGKYLFDHWIDGSGKTLRFINGEWGAYMKANHSLFLKIYDYLDADAKTRAASGRIHNRLNMVMKDNDYTTGYGLLHGTDRTVGGFEIWGDVTVNDGVVSYDLLFTWHDIIDPNPNEDFRDGIYGPILKTFTNAKDYNIHISWSDTYEFKK